MRNVLLLVVFALAACGQSEAEMAQARQDRQDREFQCELLQTRADRIEAQYFGIRGINTCESYQEEYRSVVEEAETLSCPDFESQHWHEAECPPYQTPDYRDGG